MTGFSALPGFRYLCCLGAGTQIFSRRGWGFPGPGFVSSDYFSLLPWLLLFWTGYFLYRLRPAEPLLPDIRLPGFSAMGRHSLLIYLLHQPVLYALLVLLPTFL